VRNVTLVQVKINGTEYFRKTISATGPLDVNVLYLGGMPQMGRTIRQVEAIPDRSEITKPPVNFKGIIQDVQVTQSIYRLHGTSMIPLVFSHVDFTTKI
jgi:protein crumbs